MIPFFRLHGRFGKDGQDFKHLGQAVEVISDCLTNTSQESGSGTRYPLATEKISQEICRFNRISV